MNNYKFIAKASEAFLALLFMWAILPIQSNAAEKISIEAYKNTEIEKDDIFIKDVAQVKGNDKKLVQQIKEILLGNLPLAGEIKKIDKDLICIRLKQSGIDLSKINIVIPNDAIATRKPIDIPSEDIEQLVLNFLHNRLQSNGNRINITNIRVADKVTLPNGIISCEVTQPKNKELLGTTLLSLDYSVNGRFQKKVWVTVDIDIFARVVVTKRPLGRYKLIAEDDIHLAEMNLAKLPSSAFISSKDVVGKRARRAIDSNVILRPDLVESPPLVKKGDIVSIIAESNGLKVSTLGEVKESGTKGQIIKVENIDSAKSIYARVMDSNSVIVDW